MGKRGGAKRGTRLHHSAAVRERIIELWGSGLSVARIADAVGLRKDQVSGIAHRLIRDEFLQGRGSPIRYAAQP